MVRGSFAAGIGLFFLCLLACGVIVFVGGAALAAAMPEAIPQRHIPLLTLLVPWPVTFVFGIGVVIKGRIWTALGMLAGFGILAAILLVLMVILGSIFGPL